MDIASDSEAIGGVKDDLADPPNILHFRILAILCNVADYDESSGLKSLPEIHESRRKTLEVLERANVPIWDVAKMNFYNDKLNAMEVNMSYDTNEKLASTAEEIDLSYRLASYWAEANDISLILDLEEAHGFDGGVTGSKGNPVYVRRSISRYFPLPWQTVIRIADTCSGQEEASIDIIAERHYHENGINNLSDAYSTKIPKMKISQGYRHTKTSNTSSKSNISTNTNKTTSSTCASTSTSTISTTPAVMTTRLNDRGRTVPTLGAPMTNARNRKLCYRKHKIKGYLENDQLLYNNSDELLSRLEFWNEACDFWLLNMVHDSNNSNSNDSTYTNEHDNGNGNNGNNGTMTFDDHLAALSDPSSGDVTSVSNSNSNPVAMLDGIHNYNHENDASSVSHEQTPSIRASYKLTEDESVDQFGRKCDTFGAPDPVSTQTNTTTTGTKATVTAENAGQSGNNRYALRAVPRITQYGELSSQTSGFISTGYNANETMRIEINWFGHVREKEIINEDSKQNGGDTTITQYSTPAWNALTSLISSSIVMENKYNQVSQCKFNLKKNHLFLFPHVLEHVLNQFLHKDFIAYPFSCQTDEKYERDSKKRPEYWQNFQVQHRVYVKKLLKSIHKFDRFEGKEFESNVDEKEYSSFDNIKEKLYGEKYFLPQELIENDLKICKNLKLNDDVVYVQAKNAELAEKYLTFATNKRSKHTSLVMARDYTSSNGDSREYSTYMTAKKNLRVGDVSHEMFGPIGMNRPLERDFKISKIVGILRRLGFTDVDEFKLLGSSYYCPTMTAFGSVKGYYASNAKTGGCALINGDDAEIDWQGSIIFAYCPLVELIRQVIWHDIVTVDAEKNDTNLVQWMISQRKRKDEKLNQSLPQLPKQFNLANSLSPQHNGAGNINVVFTNTIGHVIIGMRHDVKQQNEFGISWKYFAKYNVLYELGDRYLKKVLINQLKIGSLNLESINCNYSDLVYYKKSLDIYLEEIKDVIDKNHKWISEVNDEDFDTSEYAGSQKAKFIRSLSSSWRANISIACLRKDANKGYFGKDLLWLRNLNIFDVQMGLALRQIEFDIHHDCFESMRWTSQMTIDPNHNDRDEVYVVPYQKKSAPRGKFDSYLEYFMRN